MTQGTLILAKMDRDRVKEDELENTDNNRVVKMIYLLIYEDTRMKLI